MLFGFFCFAIRGRAQRSGDQVYGQEIGLKMLILGGPFPESSAEIRPPPACPRPTLDPHLSNLDPHLPTPGPFPPTLPPMACPRASLGATSAHSGLGHVTSCLLIIHLHSFTLSQTTHFSSTFFILTFFFPFSLSISTIIFVTFSVFLFFKSHRKQQKLKY